jgi:hypothetical protein
MRTATSVSLTGFQTACTPAFRKILPARRAEAELRGWQAVSDAMQVPRLLAHAQVGELGIVSYEHVFGSGKCQLLLGDLIGQADRDPQFITHVEALIDGICRDLCTAAERTGRVGQMAECVPALYADRIRPGGRIDQWYLPQSRPDHRLPDVAGDRQRTDLRDYTGWQMHVNGRAWMFDLAGIIGQARAALGPGRWWRTAITQGDPTEPNIAFPLCWLDFEHAGRSVLAGEVANLLWYLIGMGGWLVPRYQPDVYARTLRLALPPVTGPTLTSADISTVHRRAMLSYVWEAGPGRAAAIRRLLAWLDGDLGAAIGQADDQRDALLRPFLVLRILGVIPVSQLNRHDSLLILAKLAEASDPDTPLSDFARTTISDQAEGTA